MVHRRQISDKEYSERVVLARKQTRENEELWSQRPTCSDFSDKELLKEAIRKEKVWADKVIALHQKHEQEFIKRFE